MEYGDFDGTLSVVLDKENENENENKSESESEND